MGGQRPMERVIALVAFPGLLPLDLMGSHTILTTRQARPHDCTVVVISAHTQPLELGAALTLVPTQACDAVPQP